MGIIEEKINLEIDTKAVAVSPGSTVLDAARKLEIKIPTLCSHKALSNYGACRLCLVEIVRKDGSSTLQTSCTYPASNGLIVRSVSERIKKTRKIMVELTLARCPDSLELQNLAKELGVKRSRIIAQNKDCMLCGLCVRVCQEKMGRGAINFLGRGQEREVASAFNKFSNICQVCGACDFICPVNKKILPGVTDIQPKSIPFEFNVDLAERPAVYISYPQAVPNVPLIDENYCAKLLTGECGICKDICEADAVDYDQKEEQIILNVGAVILTSGIGLFDPVEKKEYGYDRYENVLSSIQFERILSSSGPTQGEIIRPSDGSRPRKIAFIQCVGSRDESVGNEFCSSVCCMYSIKEAMIAKEHDPNIEPTIFYIDIRSFGKDFERYYESAKDDQGVNFIRSKISKIYEQPKTKNLRLRYIEGDMVKIAEFDMVVLAIGLTSSKGCAKLAKSLDLKVNDYGFLKTDKELPGCTQRQGIFVAGTCSEPKDIPETVSEGSSAAALASGLLADARGSLVYEKRYVSERDLSGEDLRIGVFVCRCGRNISAVVDVPSVVEYASKLRDVAHSEEFMYSCSKDALDVIKQRIEEHNLNRVVVASCTPRTHEELFQDTIREAGLNRYLFEMASLREQVSWVHKDYPEEATQKSKELVDMMVAKVRELKPLQRERSEVIAKALVIGAGASGMQAALHVSGQGYEVFLIEKENNLGGNLNHLFDGLEEGDPQEFFRGIVSKINNDKRIEIITKVTLKSISGFMGNFKTTIEVDDKSRDLEHGVVILATGADEYVPFESEYGYGLSDKIITQVDLEEKLAKKDKIFKTPMTTVMIQCVGSRSKDRPYCSRVCCLHAVKNALKLKEMNPEHKIIVLYRDIRTYGFMEKYYLRAREAGVVFLSFDLETNPKVSVKNDTIAIKHSDNILGGTIEFKPDFLVLSTGIVGSRNVDISKILKTPLNSDNFFMEAHAKIRPLDFTNEGMFFCGLAHSPRFLQESLSQAQGASIRAVTIISKDTIEAKAVIAEVNERLCKGCGLCVSACPYEARIIDEETKVAKVTGVLCQGCGACAVACPSSATKHRGFNKKQIMRMIEKAI